METTKRLVDLPIEVLLHIFDYIPSRWNLSLVCWNFYEIICEIEKENFAMKLIDLNNDEKYQSIMNSKRTFSDVKVVNFRSSDYHVSQKLQKIIDKIAARVQRLKIASSVFRQTEVLKLLKPVVHVKEISFYDVEFSDDEEDNEDLMEELDLYELRRIEFHLCNVKIPRIVLRLPSSVLKTLVIESCILGKETLRLIFESQRNIEELEFNPYYVDPSSTEHLKLTKMKLMCNSHVASLLRSQRHSLSFLDISRAPIVDNEFFKVCKLQNLKSLKLCLERVSWENLENLEKLRKLKELHLNYDFLDVEYMRSISRIKLSNVLRLKLKLSLLTFSTENFIELSLNMPNLKELHIRNQSIGSIEILVQNFKNLETLVIGCNFDSSEVVDFPIRNVCHDKLKSLCIYSIFPHQKMLKCTKTILDIVNNSLKNLEKLKLQNVMIFSSEQLGSILTSHKNLTHLYIANPDQKINITDEALEVLHMNGKNLKYFQSIGAEFSIHKKILEREFCKQFSIIKIKPWKKQIVLRNCKWEHGED